MTSQQGSRRHSLLLKTDVANTKKLPKVRGKGRKIGRKTKNRREGREGTGKRWKDQWMETVRKVGNRCILVIFFHPPPA